MHISWIDPLQLVEFELRQRKEEGRDVESLLSSWTELRRSLSADDVRTAARQFLDTLLKDDKFNSVPSATNQLLHTLIRDDKNYSAPAHEPSEFAEIIEHSPASGAPLKVSAVDDIRAADCILGGWLGRAAGCLLGKPVERIQRQGIREVLSSNNSWPLTNYISELGIPEETRKKYTWNRHSGRESLRENIECMTEDDDLNYTMLNLHVLESFGVGFTTDQVLECWLSLLPVMETYTAERVAYVNALNGVRPPATAMLRNPYREWIGAQIRADMWGWVTPGNPMRAVELAWRDARLSHIGNGIYGEMFAAAAVAATFSAQSMTQVVETAVSFIPAESRLALAVRFALSLPQREPSWEGAVDRLYEKFGSYHWVHSVNNAALVAAALLYGGGDYERSICNVVMGGWDTDSNGATVGSIVGTMHGASALPKKWTAPLQNRIRSSMKGFDNSSFTDLAERTVRMMKLGHRRS